MEFFLQLFSSGICVGVIYGLGAVGFVIVYKAAGIFNIAHGELMMIGAFFAVTFTRMLGFPVWISIFLALAVSGIVCYIIQYLIIRPMIGQPHISILMITVGMMMIIRAAVIFIWGTEDYSMPGKLIPIPPIHFGKVLIPTDYISGLIIGVIVFVFFGLYFGFTRSGLKMRATSDNNFLAESMGVRVSGIVAMAWVLSGISAAVGGIVLGSMTSVDYMLGEVGLMVLPVVIFGGMESILGAIVGGIVIGVTSIVTGGYMEGTLPGFKDVAPYIIILLIFMFRPYGLFGQKTIERI